MGCISKTCPQRTTCKKWYDYTTSDVDWERHGSGGSDKFDSYDCGPLGNYAMYEPLEKSMIYIDDNATTGERRIDGDVLSSTVKREMACAICNARIILSITERDRFICDECRNALIDLISERNGNEHDELPTSEEYRNSRLFTLQTKTKPNPSYKCPKCGGGMCKDLTVVLTSYPAQYYYTCNECGYRESNY